jgi:hypothetical protein
MVVKDDDNFWSSAGAYHKSSQDYLVFKLKAPLCVVHAVQLDPYRAIAQQGCALNAGKCLHVTLKLHARR